MQVTIKFLSKVGNTPSFYITSKGNYNYFVIADYRSPTVDSSVDGVFIVTRNSTAIKIIKISNATGWNVVLSGDVITLNNPKGFINLTVISADKALALS